MASQSGAKGKSSSKKQTSKIDQRFRSVLLFGAPGTGKGTQGNILKHVPGFFHFSIGDALRNLDHSTGTGKIFYEYSSRGELVPDEYIIKLWAETLHAHAILGMYKPHRELLILDGIPRTVSQAQIMERHIDVLRIVHLICNDENAMIDRLRKRALKENRIDDADEKVIRRRFAIYEEVTKQVIDHYPQEIICRVECMGSPARVLSDIIHALAPIQDEIYNRAMDQ